MTAEQIEKIIQTGENIHTEFKRCGNGFEKDIYETVCSFSNRFGGNILCGVLDDGKITGIPENAISGMIKNFTSTISNPEIFNPTLYLSPEVVEVESKKIIFIKVPLSSNIHSYKGKFYDRSFESDVLVKGNEKLTEMLIRKQDIFTEQKLFPYASIADLKPGLIERCRRMAFNRLQNHPWKDMSDEDLLRSAGLLRKDFETGKTGLNRAGLLLLGQDDVIQSICPQYKTDALLRKINLDRYDDREIIQTNLVDSFDLLMIFTQKHLNNKFYLEGIQNVSLRDKISREIISNILMHREYTSPFISKLVIEKDKMYTENPCKAQNQFEITPEKFTPISKNPLIAKFFTNIGYADELGSGTRNLFHYTMLYSGERPRMIEDDIFRTIVPLHDEYSADFGTHLPSSNIKKTDESDYSRLSEKQQIIIQAMKENPKITQEELCKIADLSRSAVQANTKQLKNLGIIAHTDSKKSGSWIVIR